MARAQKNVLGKTQMIAFQQGVDECGQHYKLTISGGTKHEFGFVHTKTATSVVTSVELFAKDRGKYKGMSDLAESPVKINFAFGDASTFSVSCSHKAKVFDVVTDRVEELMVWYKAKCAGKDLPIMDEWKHITPFLRVNPAFYYAPDNSIVYDGVSKFDSPLLNTAGEKKIRDILDHIMSVPDFVCKERLVKVICHSFQVTLPDTVKTEIKAEKRRLKTEQKGDGSSSTVVVDITNSSDEEDSDTVLVEHTGRMKKEER